MVNQQCLTLRIIGKTIDKRREEHKARRGVKKAKVPAYKVNEEDKAFNYVVAKLRKQHGKVLE